MTGENTAAEMAKTQVRHYRHWAWLVLVAVILLTAAVRIRLLDTPLERDEGEYAYAGQLILQGVAPYAQVYNMKMPGIYAAYALILAALGQTQGGIHFGLLVINAATILLLFLLTKRLFGPLAGAAAAGAFALLSLGQHVQGLFANAEHFVLVVAIGGLLLLVRAEDRQKWFSLAAGAVLLGLAFVMKQHGRIRWRVPALPRN
jgi:4-amino-4-deoxy-L-arabinose transferase-like glycosyltransferase